MLQLWYFFILWRADIYTYNYSEPRKNSLRAFRLYNFLKFKTIQHLFVQKALKIIYLQSGNLGTSYRNYKTKNTNQIIFRIPEVNKDIFRQSMPYIFIKSCPNKNQFCCNLKGWLSTTLDISYIFSALAWINYVLFDKFIFLNCRTRFFYPAWILTKLVL